MGISDFPGAGATHERLAVDVFTLDVIAEQSREIPVHDLERSAMFRREDEAVALIARRAAGRPRIEFVEKSHETRIRIVLSGSEDYPREARIVLVLPHEISFHADHAAAVDDQAS